MSFTDASHYAAGVILYQRDENGQPGRELKVIGYYSCTFTKPQENYTTTEKEALAVVMALRYFRSYLEGKHFKLFTDNQALTYLLELALPKGRIARWVSEIQQFSFDITHRPGQRHQDADALSRLHVPQEISKGSVNLMQLWEGRKRWSCARGNSMFLKQKCPQC